MKAAREAIRTLGNPTAVSAEAQRRRAAYSVGKRGGYPLRRTAAGIKLRALPPVCTASPPKLAASTPVLCAPCRTYKTVKKGICGIPPKGRRRRECPFPEGFEGIYRVLGQIPIGFYRQADTCSAAQGRRTYMLKAGRDAQALRSAPPCSAGRLYKSPRCFSSCNEKRFGFHTFKSMPATQGMRICLRRLCATFHKGIEVEKNIIFAQKKARFPCAARPV